MSAFWNCTEVSATCPVEATTYGYYPSFPANSVLLTVFALIFCVQTILTFLTRVYSYSIVVAIGSLMELLGYAARIMMHHNPWDSSAMKMQIICLILAPSFLAAGIYLTVKHTIMHFGAQYSKLKPFLYTWIFIGSDAISILLQAVGGGIASGADDDKKQLDLGNNIMIAGIVFQVATMAICGVLAIDYGLRRYRHRQFIGEVKRQSMPTSQKGRIFQAAICFAYVTVMIRCIYRIPEMAGGWGNPTMRNEKEFLILDGL
ncbi:putative rta1 domain protein [Ilyonectria robusta]